MPRATMSFLAIAAVLICTAPAQAQKIGVVDIVKVFNNCMRVKELTKGLDAQREKMEKEALAMEKKITKILLMRDQRFKKGSPEYLRLTRDALKLQFDLKSFKSYSTQYLLVQHQLHTEAIYDEILAEVAKYAKQYGFELILALDDINMKGSKSYQELLARIAQKKVLFHAESVDLTAVILKKVDEPRATPAPAGP